MDCPFCHFEREKDRLIEVKKFVLVIFSDPRLMPGHILVIPKRHIEKVSQLNDRERRELLATLIEYEQKIIAKFAAGCDIRQQYRPFQKEDGIKVSHLHFHLLPREFRDELYQKCLIFEKQIFQKLSQAEIEQFRKLLSD